MLVTVASDLESDLLRLGVLVMARGAWNFLFESFSSRVSGQ